MTTPGCISTFRQAQQMPEVSDSFFTQRELLNTMLFVSVKRRGREAWGCCQGWEKVCVHSGRIGPVRTCTHTMVQTKCSSADERTACLEETRAGKEVHF